MPAATVDPDDFNDPLRRYRRLFESRDVFKAFQESQERYQKLFQSRDVFKAFQESQERYRKLFQSPGLIEAFQESQERYQKLFQSPGLIEAFHESQERYRKLFETRDVFKAFQESQERYRKLFESPQWAALSTSFVEQFDDYNQDLLDRLAGLAAKAEAEVSEGATPEEVAAWFGFESRQMLIWRMEGLLRSLEVVATATGATAEVTDVEMPAALLCLLVMFFATAELLLYLTKGPPGPTDDPDP